jgi:plasmid maintenance system antidote protein VapI
VTLLGDALDGAGISQALLSLRTGLSAKHINQIVKGKCRLSVDAAVRIEMAVPSISAEGLLIAQVREELRQWVAEHGR